MIVFYVEPDGNLLAVLVHRGVRQYESPPEAGPIERVSYYDAIGEKYTPPDGTIDVICAPLDWLSDECRQVSMAEAFKLHPRIVQRAKEETST